MWRATNGYICDKLPDILWRAVLPVTRLFKLYKVQRNGDRGWYAVLDQLTMPRDNCDFMGNNNRGFNSQHRGNYNYRSWARRGMLLGIVDLFVRRRAFFRRLVVGHHYPTPFVIFDVLCATGKLLLRAISSIFF